MNRIVNSTGSGKQDVRGTPQLLPRAIASACRPRSLAVTTTPSPMMTAPLITVQRGGSAAPNQPAGGAS